MPARLAGAAGAWCQSQRFQLQIRGWAGHTGASPHMQPVLCGVTDSPSPSEQSQHRWLPRAGLPAPGTAVSHSNAMVVSAPRGIPPSFPPLCKGSAWASFILPGSLWAYLYKQLPLIKLGSHSMKPNARGEEGRLWGINPGTDRAATEICLWQIWLKIPWDEEEDMEINMGHSWWKLFLAKTLFWQKVNFFFCNWNFFWNTLC